MSEPFLGEIRIVAFTFAPRGWAFCDGQILPISQNQSLYSLLGTTYGGDGRTSFALPDLRGRTPIHEESNGHQLGERGGGPDVSLSLAEMPTHTHALNASASDGNVPVPHGTDGYVLARTVNQIYGPPTNLVPLSIGTVANVGGSSHANMQPYLALNFCIALRGLFPSRN